MRARLHRNSFGLKPLGKLLRTREHSNSIVIAQSITSLLAQKPGIVLRILFYDHRRRHPQLFDVKTPVALKRREPIEVEKRIRPLRVIVVAVSETYNIKG